MQHYDIKYIDQITQTTPAARQTLLRWMAKQGEKTIIEMAKLQGDLASQNRKYYVTNKRPEFYHSMLILALIKMRWLETSTRSKSEPGEERKTTEIRIQRILAKNKSKTAPKKNYIQIRCYEEIKQLLEKGLSWRQIADYIATYHKKRLSHGYLEQCYRQLQKEDEYGRI